MHIINLIVSYKTLLIAEFIKQSKHNHLFYIILLFTRIILMYIVSTTYLVSIKVVYYVVLNLIYIH
jgi:hypothetical protein